MEQLIAGLYESAMAPDPMDSFLEAYAERMGANSGAVIVLSDLRQGGGRVVGSARTDWEFQAKYGAYYSRLNVYVERLKRLPCRGDVRNGEILVPECELIRTEYYNDYLKPQRVHYSIGTALELDNGIHIHLGAVRSKEAGNFCAREQAIAEALAPHFAQAIRMRERLMREGRRYGALSELVDALPFGVIQVSVCGKVIDLNRRALEMLQAGDGLVNSEGTVRALAAGEAKRMAALLAEAATGSGAGGSMLVSRRSGARPFVVEISPVRLPEQMRMGRNCAAALVVVTDPEEGPRYPAGRLRELCGLTPAEERVCVELTRGKDLRGIAETMGTAVGTVRTHLKRVFSKTNTSRQPELIRLLLTGFPMGGGGSSGGGASC